MLTKREFTVKEVADVLGVSTSAIYTDIKRGNMETLDLGKGQKKHIITDVHIKKRFGDEVGESLIEGLKEKE